MSRIITNREMERRQALAAAVSKLTNAMAECQEMTPMEWIRVLVDLQHRMTMHGLQEEWTEE